jgi:FlaA1/EpsC-like NDP-sugar epimerase/lipopolysaccharide/colanic/teichoic acid biosynthesis glycosyltransferase
MIKRVVDILGACFLILVCAPILVLIAILIKLDGNGPVFFKQVRVGKGFRHFSRLKFRTEVHEKSQKSDAPEIGGLPRLTRTGRVLRQFKLDELPQFLNVLKGEMSLVGPRPEDPYYVDKFINEYQEILTVRPGLMDLAFLMYDDDLSIFGSPTFMPRVSEAKYLQETIPEKIRLGKLYIEHASFAFDLAIMAQTLLKLFGFRPVLLKVRPSHRAEEIEDTAVFKFLYRYRGFLFIVLDLGLIVMANYLAFWLRFDGQILDRDYQLFAGMLPWLLVIRLASFMLFGLNEGLWRYVSIWDVKKIVVGVLSGTVIFYGIVSLALGATGYPRSIFIMDSILLIGFLVGLRLAVRLFRERKVLSRMRRVLVIGAGDAGAQIVGEMQAHPSCSYAPIGYVDDNLSKLGKRIHGVKVLGTRHDLEDLLSRLNPEEVLVALPGVDPGIVREFYTILAPFKLPIKTLPRLEDILEGKVSINQIRSLSIEDLLQRPPVDLNPQPVKGLIAGKRVFVTGAGGSIGSELCRQIVEFRPQALILYERHENSLYAIGSELADHGHSSLVHPVIGDITDVHRLNDIIQAYRPDVIFHAAAHKHVPLMELNPGEAFRNNVLGTQLVAEAAAKNDVAHFVFISTDKAVNPSSVMGATKRVAELVIQAMAQRSSTCFLSVRFGNVLGSNGSVVPRFQEQIRAGGPVTVTHPEVRRYFMSIPEAVGLVLQAATLGEQGAIYLLEMGDQIKLVDLARNLIGLSGHIPDKEIAIEFVGLRPGEKLEEELVGIEEDAMPSSLDKILKVGSRTSVDDSFLLKVQEMADAFNLNDYDAVIKNLQDFIPTFNPTKILEHNGSPGDLSPQVESVPAVTKRILLAR